MAQRTILGSSKLAKDIKMRRNELNLTIEEAASRAGVGTKTWCRYEAGGAIRQDKCRGVCKALNWHTLPGEEDLPKMNREEYHNHEVWSKYLEEEMGESAAISFVIGSDILLDHVEEDIQELARMPKGSHEGQLEVSFIADQLPLQFLPLYDYDFLYAFRSTIIYLRKMAHLGNPITVHSVLEELALYMIVEESRFLMECENLIDEEDWDEWIYDIIGDMDIIDCLYNNKYLPSDHIYHFKHWMKDFSDI